MEFHFLPIFTLLWLALAGTCHGSLPAGELHWQSEFPKTQMPKSLQNLLPPGNKNAALDEMVIPNKDAKDHIAQSNLYATDKKALQKMVNASKYAKDHIAQSNLYAPDKDAVDKMAQATMDARDRIAQSNLYAANENALDKMVQASKDARSHTAQSNLYPAGRKALDKMVEASKDTRDHIAQSNLYPEGRKALDKIVEASKDSRDHIAQSNLYPVGREALDKMAMASKDAKDRIAQSNLYAANKKSLDKMVEASKDARDHIAQSNLYATNKNALSKMVKASKDAKDHIAQSNLYAADKKSLDKMVEANKDTRDHIAQSNLYPKGRKVLDKMVEANKDARDHIAQSNLYAVTNGANDASTKPQESFATISKNIYFFEKDLRPGKMMQVLQLQKTANSDIAFLPRAVAGMIPFSSDKFSEILKYFSVKADSVEANIMKQTIEDCERPAIGGENKFCATSLESLIDLTVSKLGKGIQVLSTEVEKETENEEFTIVNGVKMMGEKDVVCHKLKYPYAVFYCHSIDKTAVYGVPLVGSDGTRARAIAVCHRDTSSWNPNHLAFQILKVKPGTIPICHFLARETLAWVPKN